MLRFDTKHRAVYSFHFRTNNIYFIYTSSIIFSFKAFTCARRSN